MADPGPSPRITLEDVLAVFSEHGQAGTPLTAAEVAEVVDCARRTAHRKLEQLADRGDIETKKVGARSRVWWLPGGADGAPAGDVVHDQFGEFIIAIEEYAIFVLDSDGTVASWNEGAERTKGYGREEIIGEPVSTFYTDTDVERGVPRRNLDAAARRGSIETEGYRVRADGTKFWAEVVITAITDDDGTLQGFTKVTRDCTERKRRQEELRRERDQTEEVLETAPIAMAIQDGDGSTVTANRRAQELLGLSESELEAPPDEREGPTLYDAEGQPLAPGETPATRVRATEGPIFDEIIGIEPPNGDRTWVSVNAKPIFDADDELDRVVLAGEDITKLKEQRDRHRRGRENLAAELESVFDRVSDAFYALDDEWQFTYINEQAESLIGHAPDEALGEPVWSVVPDEAEEKVRARFEEAMANQEPVSFDLYLEALDSYFEVRAYPSEGGLSVYHHDITGRIEREQQLMESRRRYRTLVEHFPNGAVTMYTDESEGIRYTIGGGEILGDGWTSGEGLEGALVSDALPDALVSDLLPSFRAALDGQKRSFEVDYEGRVFQFRTAPVRNDEGEVFAGMAMSYDDTERAERERALERYRTIIETVNDGVYTVDEQGAITQVNETYAEMVGYPRAELVGMPASALVADDIASDAQELERELVEDTRETATLEAELETATGASIVAQATFSILPGPNDDYERVAVVRDITEMKERERELREYQRIIETVDDGVYLLDGGGRFHWVNDGFVEMTGFERSELVGEQSSTIFGETFEERRSADTDGPGNASAPVTVVEEQIRTAVDETLTVESRLQPYESGDHQGQVGVVRDITERKEYERELERYEALIEESTDVNAIVDEEGEIEFITPSSTYVLGYAPPELQGENAFEYIHPEDRTETFQEFEMLAEGSGDRRTVEFRFEHADGSWVWLEARGRNLQETESIDGIVVYTRDVSDRKVYERELEDRARQQQVISQLGRQALEDPPLDDLFEEASRLVAETLDTDFCKILELEADADELRLREGIGWSDGLVGEATVPADESQAGYTLAADEPVVVEDLATDSRFDSPDLLSDHDVSSGVSTVIGSPHGPWGILGTHDTEERSFAAEDVDFVQSVANVLGAAIERRSYQEDLEQLVVELEESNERLERFAYLASHDLQEPLRMVSSYVQLLESRYADDLDGEAQEFIDYAVTGAERMREMIDGLLEYSRVDTEVEPFEPTNTDEAVERVVSDLAVTIADSDADIEVGSLPTVPADRKQLEQVFQNLITNAIKYSGDDPPSVEITAERGGDEWIFSVADDGIGMEPDNTDRIFDVFDRLHAADEYSGTGIGLALCQKIVQRHGGDIWVETEPGEGSTFSFSLPITPETGQVSGGNLPGTVATDGRLEGDS